MAKSVDKCPAYRTISAACDGSEKSMDKLLKFYDAYISKNTRHLGGVNC